MEPLLETRLAQILTHYQQAFEAKVQPSEMGKSDVLMEIFGITPAMKQENRQYWGRELGMCWQRLVMEVFQNAHPGYGAALKFEQDEPCDFTLDTWAIDTKYRIGSGDSGTLKKFKAYGQLLQDQGYQPILLILRDDNLASAIQACRKGGWQIYTDQATFDFIQQHSQLDFRAYLTEKAATYAKPRPKA
jgi:hypothetical protein